MAEQNAGNEKLMGALAYLGWWVTGIIFLLIEKKNPYVRFHAMQSIVVFGSISLLNIVLGIIPIFGWLLLPIIWIGGFVLWLILMWKAYSGEKYKLPYFGDLAEKQLVKFK